MGKVRQYLSEYAPKSRAGRTLVAVAVTDSIGTGLYLAGSVLYFVRGVGLPAEGVGRGLAIAGVVGLLTTVPLGLLGDRIGAKSMLMAIQTWRAVMLVLLAFVSDLSGFVVGAIGLTIAVRAAYPASQALVANVITGPDRVSTMAMMRSVRNVGYSLGALLTAPIFAADTLWAYRSILLVNALTFLVSVVLLATLRVPTQSTESVAGRARRPAGVKDLRFMALSLLNGVFALHNTMLAIAVPLWALATDAPRWLVSVLFAVNTVLAVVFQVASARGSDQPGFGGRALTKAAFSLAAACLFFAAAVLDNPYAEIAALVLGVAALTGGELWQSAGSWELAFRLSPPERRSEYLAAFNLGQAVADIAGPLLFTAAVAYRSPGWIVLAALFLVASLLIRPFVGAAERRATWNHPAPEPTPAPAPEPAVAPAATGLQKGD
ncbi:membrane protein [Catellatospora sp. TT07R-123]|uniref:MFS transporter n=1 Tax=Catellatospora sp. TT07R-123 TaxID=2733863 RepID=UPI001B06D4C3|nr:MFS transporter [Catellatospora sp. TT07R-123]GHJ44219.1 membrane protein [Catellatospora sp. TT07R-123]